MFINTPFRTTFGQQYAVQIQSEAVNAGNNGVLTTMWGKSAVDLDQIAKLITDWHKEQLHPEHP